MAFFFADDTLHIEEAVVESAEGWMSRIVWRKSLMERESVDSVGKDVTEKMLVVL